MPTNLHRLQISLPRRQAQFLRQRAEQDGVSMAEVVRRLIEADADVAPSGGTPESLWEIAGIAEDEGALIDGVAVSRQPELYLAAAAAARRSGRPQRSTRSGAGRGKRRRGS